MNRKEFDNYLLTLIKAYNKTINIEDKRILKLTLTKLRKKYNATLH